MSEQFLSENQVAAMVSRTEQTLRLWRKKNKGPKYQKDEFGKVHYKEQDVLNWMKGKSK